MLVKYNEYREGLLGFLNEGGAAGHMLHPYENNDLLFDDIIELINMVVNGSFSVDNFVQEKVDGQNVFVSYKSGKIIAARNKGHLKNFGEAAPDLNGIKAIFDGRGTIEEAYVRAMQDISNALMGLSHSILTKYFAEGKYFLNLEIIYGKTSNVIIYGQDVLIFHGIVEVDIEGNVKGMNRSAGVELQKIITDANSHVQKTFNIIPPRDLNLPPIENAKAIKSKLLGDLKGIMSKYKMKPHNTIYDMKYVIMSKYLSDIVGKLNISLDQEQMNKLINRFVIGDKSYSISAIKADTNSQFVDVVKSLDSEAPEIISNELVAFRLMIVNLGILAMKNVSAWLAFDPKATVQKIRQDVKKSIKDITDRGTEKDLERLKKQLEQLDAMGGINSDNMLPTEGIVFTYKDKLYKFTGMFAPINQILGILKYG